jgi:hypothetical protein
VIDKEKLISKSMALLIEWMDYNEILPDIGLSAMLNISLEVAYDHNLDRDEFLSIISKAWDQLAERQPRRKRLAKMKPSPTL